MLLLRVLINATISRDMSSHDVYLEVGKKRVFAAAVAWPGWCRSGRDEESALQVMVDYGPRYSAAIGKAGSDFIAPAGVRELNVVERLPGDATTDFGAPHIPASTDSRPLKLAELDRLLKLLQACWEAFDAAARASAATGLRAGPRGGGRDIARMRQHVVDSDGAYVSQLGGRFRASGFGVDTDVENVRRAFLEAAAARARGEVPDRGPRGGLRWSPRYAIRRSAWHSLDHAWEIADRST
jgi:hypothetical protein